MIVNMCIITLINRSSCSVRRRFINLHTSTFVRQVATKNPDPNAANGPNATAQINWIPIYQFPFIHAISGLNKIKLYQAALTSGGIPATMLLESTAILPVGSANIFAVLGVTGTMALCVFSALARNCVGFVYTDSLADPKNVRISHIDFWGRRNNVELPVDDLIAPGDSRKLPLDLWVNVKFQNKSTSLKMFHRHGVISHPEAFSWIFGDC